MVKIAVPTDVVLEMMKVSGGLKRHRLQVVELSFPSEEEKIVSTLCPCFMGKAVYTPPLALLLTKAGYVVCAQCRSTPERHINRMQHIRSLGASEICRHNI